MAKIITLAAMTKGIVMSGILVLVLPAAGLSSFESAHGSRPRQLTKRPSLRSRRMRKHVKN